MSKTISAFDQFRECIGDARMPREGTIRHPDQCREMQPSDGLVFWVDGAVQATVRPTRAPLLNIESVKRRHLWVVRQEDVVHAPENCQFGNLLNDGMIKHTNLTGGAPAFCGGEMVFCADGSIVVNGCSGRYGPRNSAEMMAVATAFKASGYSVWSMGYDDETNRPTVFLGFAPEWVE